ncbi:hypothetical protein HYFRA_00004303 [Hymenoscyphus fraxineus]|uniref:C2H2-type domain-containing protein n=1 Tax=Hymenoscyphus fraxineus TaxID=746836 RepID=A0A9N9PKJ6_9HELO|nr:hypothetical protein HYFRA_00004303 [Hymenoscyphus fraxineus]
MSLHSTYRSGGHPRSYYPQLASINSPDSGQIYGTTREMGPPPLDFPPQPVEIDVDLSSHSSRTLPSPSQSGSNAWDPIFSHPSFGDASYGASNIGRMQQIPSDTQSRGPAQDPLVQWYTGNDGPWVPKVIPDVAIEERLHPRQSGNRSHVSYGTQYRQPNPSDAGSVQFGVSNSDSGYGTRRSIGNGSVFSADIQDRDQDCQSLAGHVENFQPFHAFPEILPPRDHTRVNDWTPTPKSTGSNTPSLICQSCMKPVKTQSELKKHELRHTKPFKCQVPGCPRPTGFSTTNDLERHTKSKHPTAITDPASTKMYRCNVPGCKSREKSWPRLDNFRSHLKRVHQNQLRTDRDFEEMIRCAEFFEAPPSSGMPSQENALPQRTMQQESSHSAISIQDNNDRNGDTDWSGSCPEVDDSPPQDFTDPKRPDLEISSSPPSRKSLPPPTPQEPSAVPVPHSDGHRSETVQPLDVFHTAQPPPKPARSGFTLESVLAPAIPNDGPNKLPIFRSSSNNIPVSKLVSEGKVAKHISETSASSDAALTKVIRTALSGSTTHHDQEPPLTNGNLDRNILPNGRPSPSGNGGSGSESSGVKSSESSPSAVSDTDVTESEELKKAEEILKTIRHLGYTLQKDPSRSPKIQNQGSAASNKSEKKVTCKVCKRFQGRPCELRYVTPHLSQHLTILPAQEQQLIIDILTKYRKHMKRHERPYGCTFLSCGKTFGSKNDWKRHENSQHFQIETWRCDGSLPEGGPCSKVCYRRQSFLDHLKKDHPLPPSSPLSTSSASTSALSTSSSIMEEDEPYREKLESCRIGRNSQDRFWCGFCVQLIDLKKKGLDAWTERFDHIDDHFMGRGKFEKLGIRDWVPVDGSTNPGPKRTLSSNSSSLSPSSVSESTEAPHEKTSTSKKRAADTAEDGAAKRARTELEYQIICCQCHVAHNPSFNSGCSNCSDSHSFCESCTPEVLPPVPSREAK